MKLLLLCIVQVAPESVDLKIPNSCGYGGFAKASTATSFIPFSEEAMDTQPVLLPPDPPDRWVQVNPAFVDVQMYPKLTFPPPSVAASFIPSDDEVISVQDFAPLLPVLAVQFAPASVDVQIYPPKPPLFEQAASFIPSEEQVICVHSVWTNVGVESTQSVSVMSFPPPWMATLPL